MELIDHFNVAHLLGHTAFTHLSNALSVHANIREQSLLEPDGYSWQECLVCGGQLSALRTTELKSCVQAVILFQAMMEKVPYFVPTIGTGLNAVNSKTFATSWHSLIDQILEPNAKTTANASFNLYLADFYSGFRNPIIHGKTEADISSINNITTLKVFEGMKHGWEAYDHLLTQAFSPEQQHEPSWNVMCDAHGIPHTLNQTECPEISRLEKNFRIKHGKGVKSLNASCDESKQ